MLDQVKLRQHVLDYIFNNKVSQLKFAELCNTSPSTVSRIIANDIKLDADTFAKVADGLHQPISAYSSNKKKTVKVTSENTVNAVKNLIRNDTTLDTKAAITLSEIFRLAYEYHTR